MVLSSHAEKNQEKPLRPGYLGVKYPLVFGIHLFVLVSVSLFQLNSLRSGTLSFVLVFY